MYNALRASFNALLPFPHIHTKRLVTCHVLKKVDTIITITFFFFLLLFFLFSIHIFAVDFSLCYLFKPPCVPALVCINPMTNGDDGCYKCILPVSLLLMLLLYCGT